MQIMIVYTSKGVNYAMRIRHSVLLLASLLALTGCEKYKSICSSENTQKLIGQTLKTEAIKKYTSREASLLGAELEKIQIVIENIRTTNRDPNGAKVFCAGNLKINFGIDRFNGCGEQIDGCEPLQYLRQFGIDISTGIFSRDIEYDVPETVDSKYIYVQSWKPLAELLSTISRISLPQSRFIADKNGTILDKKANLMWAAKDNGASIDWQGAVSYCENYQDGGYKDWRMPTQAELAELYFYALKPSNCNYLTKLIELTGEYIWASETMSNNSAAVFDFRHDLGTYMDKQSGIKKLRALPVRSVKK